MNFNYVSFETILIMLHEIDMNIVTHPTAFFHCFRVLFFSGTHCKGVSKQLCVYHLYRNVFLAQTRIRLHLGCISSLETRFNTYNQNAFRNAFLELLRLSSISQYREYEECQECWSLRSCIAQFHPKHNAFKGVSKQLCVYHLYRNVILAQMRIRSPFSRV